MDYGMCKNCDEFSDRGYCYYTGEPEKIIGEITECEFYKEKKYAPKGVWIDNKIAFYHVCPFCNVAVREDTSRMFLTDGILNFCPNCGADMRGNTK